MFSLEATRGGDSIEYPQLMFYREIGKIIFKLLQNFNPTQAAGFNFYFLYKRNLSLENLYSGILSGKTQTWSTNLLKLAKEIKLL